MDPLTALGLVANIVPFIEIAAKVIKTAKEIHDSESGGLNDNINLEKYATQLNQHYSNLLAPDSPDLIGDDKELCILAAECQKLADDLLDVLERIKPADRSSKWQSLKSAAKNLWRATDKEMLEKRLKLCRSQVEAQLNQILSTNINVALRRLLDATEKDTEKLKQVESYVENLRQGVQVTSLCKEARDQLSRLISISEDAIHQTALESFLSGITFDGIHERFEMVASGYGYKFDWIKDDLYRSQENDFNWYPRKSLTTLHLEFENRNDRYIRRSKELFSNWLSFGRDIFHISAKLGAGKSTLIKNLCTNDEF
ncbi:hypothetical protein CGCTS75_v008096 [Colletotrichum tropicale]|nr:hypothetical protein CGCTS75_v008096 [Colletotrichum tropicale]